MAHFPSLTLLILTPVAGAGVVVGLEAKRAGLARGLAIGCSLLSLLWVVLFCSHFEVASGSLQFVEKHAWIPALGVNYYLGLDGLGLLMILLTAVVVLLALLASTQVQERAPLFYGLVLFLQGGLYGAFTAMNFFHWFLFWELTLIPAFFLIRLWGGKGRGPAALQFFVYTMVGSIAMLLAFLAIFLATREFDFDALANLARTGRLAAAVSDYFQGRGLSADTIMLLLFGGVCLGFAVKTPMMPFHTWLPSAYAEAPTGATMLLTGLLSKLGVYGFLRIVLPIFPAQTKTLLTLLLGLAVVTIVVSASAAFAQRDLKRMLAYSSINHLGYCLLGLFAVLGGSDGTPAQTAQQAFALNGVLLQMFNHGIVAAALFYAVGLLEQRSGGLRGLEDFGGLRKVMPVFCGLMGISLLASLGLPGLNGFVGEFLIFKGTFAMAPQAAAVATLGLLFTAVFILTILQRVFSGPLNQRWKDMPDLSPSERATLLPAIVLMFILGIWPAPLIQFFNATVLQLTAQLNF